MGPAVNPTEAASELFAPAKKPNTIVVKKPISRKNPPTPINDFPDSLVLRPPSWIQVGHIFLKFSYCLCEMLAPHLTQLNSVSS